MKITKHSIEIDVLSENDFSKDDLYYIDIAQNHLGNSYSPYSKFKVVAVVVFEDGKYVVGTNQENIAYPSGLCAERVALFYAHSEYPNSIIKKIYIIAQDKNGLTEYPISPCGACRQVMLEFENKQESPIEIIMYGRLKAQKVHSASTLLPLSFTM